MDKMTEDAISVKELLMECPYNDCNPRHCQLYDLRKLSVNERLAWEAYLTEEARDMIYQYHLDCVARCEYKRDAS